MTPCRTYLDIEFAIFNRYTRKLISLALAVLGGPEFTTRPPQLLEPRSTACRGQRPRWQAAC